MNTTRKLQGLAIAVLVLGAVTTTAFAIPSGANHANKAWSDRLNGQAAQAQANAQVQRARDAYSARLTGQIQSFDRMIQQAAAARVERANKAWSDRLTGLAEAAAN